MIRVLAGEVVEGVEDVMAVATGVEAGGVPELEVEPALEPAAATEAVVGLVVEPGVKPGVELGGKLEPAAGLAVALRFELATNSIRARRRRTNSSGE
ncbi:MAG: hypothetical protein WBK32_02320 [Candidatus Saccharicenans sp.]